MSQKNFLLARLQSHIKTHLQARRPETHLQAETQILRCKKPRLENAHQNVRNAAREPTADKTLTPQKTTADHSPIVLKRPGLCQEVFELQRTASGLCYVSSRRSKVTDKLTEVRPQRWTRDGLCSKNNKSSSGSPRKSSSSKSATHKNTKNISVCLRKTFSTLGDADPRKTTRGGSPHRNKVSSARLKRTRLGHDAVSSKRIRLASVTPRTGSSKTVTRFKTSANESATVCRRRTLTKDGSNTKPIERESNSSTRRATANGATPKNTQYKKDSRRVAGLQLGKDNSIKKSAKSTSIKKLGKIQDVTNPKKDGKAVSPKNLAKTAKLETSTQSTLQNTAKISQFAVNSASNEMLRKRTSIAVWTPPKISAGWTSLAREKSSTHVLAKKERDLRSQDGSVVYPPSISQHPIPLKAPPVVSPLQPLSVIGRRLLKNQCGECGQVLSSSAALESHVSLHTAHQPFSCSLCGKRFADSKGLKRHGRVHRNGRIHVCQQCGKGFVYRFGLTKHIQMVHSRIKPFVCQICNKGFFTKLDVEAHIRIHTGEKPFHCNLCEKKFTRRVDLNVHLRWHNGEKRHWCPYCGKGFLDFNNLKRHKYIHTGEKPHSCPHCPKHFTQSGHLKKHVKNVHKIQ